MLTELQKTQIKFSQDIGKLVEFARKSGIPCIVSEQGVLQQRKLNLKDGSVAKGRDSVHKLNGNHYRFLACDLIVWSRDGVRLTLGTEKEWKILGEFWESLDPQNDNGRTWGDANHFSRIWQGMK